MMEGQPDKGETSGRGNSAADDDIWAKLVSLESSYLDIELKSNETTICSEIKTSSNAKQEWCKITREKDRVSAVIQNKSSNSILVDGTIIQHDDATIVRCGTEIISGPKAEGYMKYMFKTMPSNEICKKSPKINLDPEHATCSICLHVWHNVVTVAPCFHNFCNGCFSQWLKTCQNRHTHVLCPQCRAVVQYVARNPFLHTIEQESPDSVASLFLKPSSVLSQDILESGSSLRHSNEETAVLDSHSLIKLPLSLGEYRELEEQVHYLRTKVDNVEHRLALHEAIIVEMWKTIKDVKEKLGMNPPWDVMPNLPPQFVNVQPIAAFVPSPVAVYNHDGVSSSDDDDNDSYDDHLNNVDTGITGEDDDHDEDDDDNNSNGDGNNNVAVDSSMMG